MSIKRNEPVPTLKAAIRLLRTIFTTALDITEFQRQISTPNVLKFTTAIIALAENRADTDLKVPFYHWTCNYLLMLMYQDPMRGHIDPSNNPLSQRS